MHFVAILDLVHLCENHVKDPSFYVLFQFLMKICWNWYMLFSVDNDEHDYAIKFNEYEMRKVSRTDSDKVL